MAGKILPPPHNLPTFYPQSLGFLQRDGRDDMDVMTADTTYILHRHQRLVVGKFVPDINNDDPSNPRYVVQAIGRLRPSRMPPLSRSLNGNRLSNASSVEETSSDTTIREELARTHRVATEKIHYTVVEPLYPFSAPSLFFPIRHGSRAGGKAGDIRSSRQINLAYHGRDRTHYRLEALTVQKK
ncbi:putative tubulin tyrosine ligase [Trypanosoma cruzi]|nr:putative tubulin tyrosine ligase [Trypanosoma cruzi]